MNSVWGARPVPMKLNNSKASLYFHTLRRLKWSQIWYRVRKKAGIPCGIGAGVNAQPDWVRSIRPVAELDFDPVFLARFNTAELMKNQVTFLHSSVDMNWDGKWEVEEKSALWNYNLHYFEYLFPLLNAFMQEGDDRYLEKTVRIIRSWIRNNPQSAGGPGWAPYTIDLRLTNWLSFYSFAESNLSEDFKAEMRQSMAEQYSYLSRHVEKDILGNHYFEDLKTLALCAVFFMDWKMLKAASAALLEECREEILADGMHFELSPMYHRIILEGLIKVYAALAESGNSSVGRGEQRISERTKSGSYARSLREDGRENRLELSETLQEIERYIQKMLDAAWSLEESLHRIPLFNDCGDNVAKSLSALVAATEACLGIRPVFKSAFPDAGFYIFRNRSWKLIVDAGQPGPTYIPGHAHCDALSFELYKDGEPVITNCGTYAYQSELRSQFRSTAFHNTVMINHEEQSQCWGAFRMAGRSSVRVLDHGNDYIRAEMTDYTGRKSRRTIVMGDTLKVIDESKGNTLTGFIHPLKDIEIDYQCESVEDKEQMYAPEYGAFKEITAQSYSGRDKIGITVRLD